VRIRDDWTLSASRSDSAPTGSRAVKPDRRSDPSGRQRDADIQFVAGEAARELLAKPAFRAAWESLESACSWTTAFQRAAFGTAWYSTYADIVTPVLVFRGDSSTALRALFPLALLADGTLVVAGAAQAEYQGWLALPDEEDFVIAALDQLKLHNAAPRLRLQFLPPGIPLGQLDGDSRWRRSLFGRKVVRNLTRLDPGETAKTLRKSGNRSKMNRLKQIGEVRLERLPDRPAMELMMDEVAAYCDLRQCAINGVMPFRDDPRKKEFHLRMMEHPGLLHATVLRVGDHIAAAHFGLASTRDVALGVIAHSPFLAAHSPGKLLLLLLGDLLAQEGFEYLDLTPEGSYKDRFATDSDEVEIREIYFRRSAYLRAAMMAAGRRQTRRAAVAVGRVMRIPETKLLDRARSLGTHLSPRQLRHVSSRTLRKLLSRWGSRSKSFLYRLPAAAARAFTADSVLTRDAIDDLCLYEPVDPAARTRREFCSQALDRLESGHHVYTFVENGQLVHHAWLINAQQLGANDLGQEPLVEPHAAILHSTYTHPRARERDLETRSIMQRAKEAATLGPADWVYILVPRDGGSARRNVERLGFERSAEVASAARFSDERMS